MGSERALPVFVQPQELHVVITNPSSYRQLLTVLNPFDFVLSYRGMLNFMFLVFIFSVEQCTT